MALNEQTPLKIFCVRYWVQRRHFAYLFRVADITIWRRAKIKTRNF